MENNLIITELNNLIELTKNNKISWSAQQNNQNIIKWDRVVDGKAFSVIIQKQQMPIVPQPIRPGQPVQQQPSFYYFLSIVKSIPPGQELMLQLNSQTEPNYKDSLTQLYAVALDSAKQSTAELFKILTNGL